MFIRLLVVLAFLFVALFLPEDVSAVSITITDYPSSIGTDSFNLTASISGATSGTNYLRVDIYKDSTINYFGETFNNSDWYGGSTYTQYLPINIQSGVTWGGVIQGRIGSPTATQYDGSGSYKIRIRRYTGGGGYTSSEANEGAVTVSINLPTATPIPPSVTNTPVPTNTATPTKTPTAIPSKYPSALPTKNDSVTESTDETKKDSQVLTKSDLDSDTPTPEVEVLGAQDSKTPLLFIALGLIFFVACGILAYFQFGERLFIWKRKNL